RRFAWHGARAYRRRPRAATSRRVSGSGARGESGRAPAHHEARAPLEPVAQPEARAAAVGVDGLAQRGSTRRVVHVALDAAAVDDHLAEQPRAPAVEPEAAPRLPAQASEGGAVLAAGHMVGGVEQQELILTRDPGVGYEPLAHAQLQERLDRDEIRR